MSMPYVIVLADGDVIVFVVHHYVMLKNYLLESMVIGSWLFHLQPNWLLNCEDLMMSVFSYMMNNKTIYWFDSMVEWNEILWEIVVLSNMDMAICNTCHWHHWNRLLTKQSTSIKVYFLSVDDYPNEMKLVWYCLISLSMVVIHQTYNRIY